MSLLARTIAALDLSPELARSYVRPCAARLAHLRRNPGDLRGLGESMLVGMAIAEHEVPRSPGWIPEVQRRAVEYAEIAGRLNARVAQTREGESPMSTETVLDYWQEIEKAQDLADANQVPVRVVRDVFGDVVVKLPWHVLNDDSTLHLAIPTYRTIDDIKARNKLARRHWFSPAAMQSFSSRVQSTIYPTADGRAYFVSSERGPDNIRKYSVRLAELDGSIRAVGWMGDYPTGRAAHAAARRLAEGGKS